MFNFTSQYFFHLCFFKLSAKFHLKILKCSCSFSGGGGNVGSREQESFKNLFPKAVNSSKVELCLIDEIFYYVIL